MARQIVSGIDIGTSLVKVIIAERVIEGARAVPKIIGTGSAESKGISRGYITNTGEAAKSIELAVSRAEKMAGVKVKRAYVSFGGVGLSGVISKGLVVISRADLEVTDRDMALALEAAEASIPKEDSVNKRIINTVPIEYKIDGKTALGPALGLKGQRLEVKALFITCLEHHLTNLISTVEEAGVEVVDIVASPVAASFVTLSKKQKKVGSLLADIGAETTSIVVFENGNLISLAVFPIGSSDITNDIALGLKVSLEDAEDLKLGNGGRVTYSKKKLDEIIAARLGDSFDLIQSHLKTIGRDALLPAGVVMTGGGSTTANIKNVASSTLKLPAQNAEIYFGTTDPTKVRDKIWAVACGLAMVGFNADDEQRTIGIRNGGLGAIDGKRWGKVILRWVSQFLP